MAYIDQVRKAKIAPRVKKILIKYGLKGSLSIHNYSTLTLNIKTGKIDFISNFNKTVDALPGVVWRPAVDSIDVNPYHFRNYFSGKARDCLTELFAVMNDGNHNNSDIQTDYFDVGWYAAIHVGRWDRPYVLNSA